jgi:nucleoside-diphosphate-sugar epimerase
MTSSKILITGAGGWLGKRLSRLLATRNETIAVVNQLPKGIVVRAMLLPNEPGSDLEEIGVEVFRGDIRKASDCATFCHGAEEAILIHTAGVIHPRRVREFYEVNRDGTRNLLEAAASRGVRRAVVVSSNSPLGLNPDRAQRFDETSPYHPYMNYGRSKMQMELSVKRIQELGKIETVLVRPPWFYGPDQPARQTVFFKMIREGKVPIVGDGGNLRSMAYVDNLCEGLLLAATVNRADGQTYWIADERPYSMTEIVNTIESLLEREFGFAVAHKRVRLPNFVSEVAMVADWLLQTVGFYHSKIHVLSEMNKNITCDIRKAKLELGYNPKVSLEEGMRRSIADCLRRGAEI